MYIFSYSQLIYQVHTKTKLPSNKKTKNISWHEENLINWFCWRNCKQSFLRQIRHHA